MNNQHPITPPLELVHQWADMLSQRSDHHVFSLIAQWGADQELEACCEWFQEFYKTESWVTHDLKHFRTARRPKPPTLKEQAITALHAIAAGANDTREQHQDLETIRTALEALPND
jgi:hypothetical protein